jgi:hypothetical protein
MLRPAILTVLIFSTATASSYAQTHPQDGIDRNLQERAVRERTFRVTLDDGPLPGPPPGGLDLSLPITLSTPGTNILEDPRKLLPPDQAAARGRAPAPQVPTGSTQLQLNQEQRQTHLQIQTRELPDATRQQASQIQQLQFEREWRAQELGDSILRKSGDAMRGH